LRSYVRAHDRDTTTRRRIKGLKNLRRKRAEILEAVASRNQDNYRDVERGNVLLIGEIPVSREEHVELSGGESEQVPVSLAGLTHLWGGSHIMADESAF